MGMYRKKPVVIEAVQLKDLRTYTLIALQNFAGLGNDIFRIELGGLIIKTLEGDMRASVGDFILSLIHI